MVTLRPASAADHTPLFELHKSIFRPQVEQLWGWDERRQQQQFKQGLDGSHTSVIELDGRTVGYLQTFTAADELRLRNLALLPEVQGRGFGSTLVRQVQQHAAGKGIPVKLSVFATNPRAEALYARLGFVRTAQTEQLIEMTWNPFW